MLINSLGNVVVNPTNLSRQHMGAFMRTLLYFAFDIDGCLIPKGGLETANNRRTVANFLKRKYFTVQIFKYICSILAQDGLKIGLCTGRSASFAQSIASQMFVPGICSFMVAEGGAVKSTYHPLTGWHNEIPDYIDSDAVRVFKEYKNAIIEIGVRELGGGKEEGKEIITSFNPPVGMKIEDYRDAFKDLLSKLGILSLLSVDNSSSAVDIGPEGINKATCLLEIVDSPSTTAVLVDANNDKGVTEQFLVNLMPKNAQPGIQEIGMQAMLSLRSDFQDLNGTVDMLMMIKEYRG
jgi:hydroxymethylpyrimidine pyrophosphatase-like HAD family hydrolase